LTDAGESAFSTASFGWLFACLEALMVAVGCSATAVFVGTFFVAIGFVFKFNK
jgi:hypothetical protein